MRRRFPLLAVAGLLLAAPAAHAGPTIALGTNGEQPSLAVDPGSGTAHVVWADVQGPRELIRYCRVPRGAAACDITRDLVVGPVLLAPGPTERPWILRRPDGTLLVVSTRYIAGDTLLWTSGDGGSTWTSPALKIGEANIFADTSAPVLGPAPGRITIPAWGTGNRRVLSMALDGSDPGADGSYASVVAADNPGAVLDFSIAPTGDGGLVGVANDGNVNAFAWRMAPGSNPASDTAWSVIGLVGPSWSPTTLASGPSGVFAMRTPSEGASYRKVVHRWAGAAFAAGTDTGLSGDAYGDLTVGPSGTVGVVGRQGPSSQLFFVRSGDQGATWSAPVRVAALEPFVGAFSPVVELAGDDRGWVVFRGGEFGRDILLANLEAIPDPPPPAVAPTPTPGAPATPGARTRRVSSTVPGASISFGVPGQCVQPGSTFRVTLSWKRKKRKGNLFVKVNRTDFSIGRRVVKVDRKAPFAQTLRVTAGARRGSTITLRARAFIKVKRGKAPKKSITAEIKVCA